MLNDLNRTSIHASNARECLDSVGKRFGVDLASAADRAKANDDDVGSAVRALLYPAIIRSLETSDPGEDPEAHQAIKAAFAEASKQSVKILVNVSWQQSEVASLQAKTGSDVAEFVSGIMSTLNLSQAKGLTPAEIAATIVGAGLFGLGPVIYYAVKDTSTTILARVAAGIGKLGVSGWASIAGVVVVELAIFLITTNASFMGLVVNNTDSDITVKDWRKGVEDKNHHGVYINHGKMTGFMVADLKNLHSDDEVQIAGPQTMDVNGVPTEFVYMGLFYAEKRAAALFGAEGALIFKAKNNKSMPHLALAYSSPYSGSNGAAVALTSDDHSAEHWWKKLKDSLALQSSASSGAYSASVTVNSASGPEACCIAVLTGNSSSA
ncbi:hypothetical protein [Sinorhizobium medicae]|uniref:hypothetical protein n=1 Tax=Sinorhizobium medicae TaxID=110321 RepID=UPI002B1BE56A|nr:hypothetical protein [Sinorhizobium medicae]WQO48506.1 hypothetical protein U8C42_27955 [Sinorhizobium medicae]